MINEEDSNEEQNGKKNLKKGEGKKGALRMQSTHDDTEIC